MVRVHTTPQYTFNFWLACFQVLCQRKWRKLQITVKENADTALLCGLKEVGTNALFFKSSKGQC